MNGSQQALLLQWLAEFDLDWCLRLNRASQWRELEQLFAAISRLGDGAFWYTLMLALLAVQGQAALPVVARILAAGALALYKWLKVQTTRPRPRPCARHEHIRISVAPLGRI